MKTNKEAILFSKYRYPEQDAGALRQHAFAKMFLELGYSVTVVGLGESTGRKTAVYDGIEYISLRYGSKSVLAKVASHCLFRRNLSRFLRKRKVDVIWVNDVGEKSFSYLKHKAKKDDISLIHDSVEWYSPEQFAKGKKSYEYIAKNRLNTMLVDSSVKVVAISKFLEEHFLRKGCATIRIPVVLDVQNSLIDKEYPSSDVLNILYAGRPASKDTLDVICQGIALLSEEERKRIKFVIRGITPENLVQNCGVSKELYELIQGCIDIKGYVSRQEIKEEMKKADLTVLMRVDNARYAKAGFPTKVVESMMNSTPVICNITSDLGMYLRNRQNSIAVKDNSPVAFVEALREALNMSIEDKINMRAEARKTAEEEFDYRKYVSVLSELL